MVLSKQAMRHETKVVDRDSERNFGTRTLVHHRRPKWEAIQEKNRALLKPICHDRSSFPDHSKVKKKNPSRSDKVDSFQDPRPKPKKRVMFKDSTLIIPLFHYKQGTEKMSESTLSTSHPSHLEQHFLTPFTLIITTCTALFQRDTSESRRRGPHNTKASSLRPTSGH